MARNVKTAAAALASTSKPVVQATDSILPRLMARDGLENVIAGVGTDRDKRSYSYYGMPRVIDRLQLENMYRGSWLAKRIVNSVADDMTREWRHFEFGDADTNPQLDALEKAERDFGVQAKFNESLRSARLYGGALLVLGVTDTKDLSKPLVVEKLGMGCLKYIHVLDRWRCSPAGALNMELGNSNFGLPDKYLLADSGIEIHASRVIRFNGQKLPYFSWLQNGRWDDSELQHVIESLLNNDTTSSAIATMLFEANVDVITSEGLADLLATKGGEDKVIKRFGLSQTMKSYNRTLLLDGSESYEKKNNTFANLADVWRAMQDDACGAADIPRTRLFGQSPGGLSSTGDSDLENYYGMLGAKQNTEMRPQLDQFDQVLVRHVLGTIPVDYSYKFNPLWVTSDTDKATMEYSRAQRDQIYLTNGVITPGLAASELRQQGTYHSMSNEDVAMAEELGTPMNPDQKLEEQANAVKQQQELDPNPAPVAGGPGSEPIAKKKGRTAGGI